MTAAQVERLAQHAGEHTALVCVLAYTGIRSGEVIGQRISSLDTLRRWMLVQENAVRIGRDIIVGTTRTAASPTPRSCPSRSLEPAG